MLDGACGYGDPTHMHRTIGMSEAAGFGAIEIETKATPDWGPAEKAMLSAIDLEKLLSVERATVEKDQT